MSYRSLGSAVLNRISMGSAVVFCYLIALTFAGALILIFVPLKDSSHLKPVDAVFFASAAVTGGSLATRKMSDFSTPQTITVLFLILFGGKIFVLALELARNFKFYRRASPVVTIGHHHRHRRPKNKEISKGTSHVLVKIHEENESDVSNPLDPLQFNAFSQKSEYPFFRRRVLSTWDPSTRAYRSEGDVLAPFREPRKKNFKLEFEEFDVQDPALQYRALRSVTYIVMFYLIIVQLAGIISMIIYLKSNPGAQEPLKERGINTIYFSVFTTVSVFANCGFVFLNEAMVPFQKFPGLLWILVFQMVLGNVMFWPCMRSIIWALSRLSNASAEGNPFHYLLNNGEKFKPMLVLGFKHTVWIAIVECGFVALQFTCLGALQWNTLVFEGLSGRLKLSVDAFQTFSTRTTGLNVVNMAQLSPTVIYIYAIMMYIPSEPVYIAVRRGERSPVVDGDDTKILTQFRKIFLRHSVALLATVVVICIVENHKVVKDPLNFSVLNMVFEAISAYGNVGMSVGYSCSLVLNQEERDACVDVPYSLAGKWSASSKLLLVPLMFLGRFRGNNLIVFLRGFRGNK